MLRLSLLPPRLFTTTNSNDSGNNFYGSYNLSVPSMRAITIMRNSPDVYSPCSFMSAPMDMALVLVLQTMRTGSP